MRADDGKAIECVHCHRNPTHRGHFVVRQDRARVFVVPLLGMGVGQRGDRFRQTQGRPLALGEQVGLSPRRQNGNSLRRLSRRESSTDVNVQAECATIDLRDAHVQQLDGSPVETRVASCMPNRLGYAQLRLVHGGMSLVDRHSVVRCTRLGAHSGNVFSKKFIQQILRCRHDDERVGKLLPRMRDFVVVAGELVQECALENTVE